MILNVLKTVIGLVFVIVFIIISIIIYLFFLKNKWKRIVKKVEDFKDISETAKSILDLMIVNPKISIAEIAVATNLSKEIINFEIEVLLKKKIISLENSIWGILK